MRAWGITVKIYVGTSTISDIKAKKDELQKFALKFYFKEGSKTKKTLLMANNSALDDDVYIWFNQR